MPDDILYDERISSNRTEALFLALAFFFLLLFARRVKTTGRNVLTAVFFCFAGLFFFYVVNYRTLRIRLTSRSLILDFGIFTWTVPLENISEFGPDELPAVMRLGGAGIHFMSIRNRYRVSFNFLEYPRLVIAFKKSVGPVRDISFSTRQPEELTRILHAAITALP
jgi:hypothetical protein